MRGDMPCPETKAEILHCMLRLLLLASSCVADPCHTLCSALCLLMGCESVAVFILPQEPMHMNSTSMSHATPFRLP